MIVMRNSNFFREWLCHDLNFFAARIMFVRLLRGRDTRNIVAKHNICGKRTNLYCIVKIYMRAQLVFSKDFSFLDKEGIDKENVLFFL